MKKLFTIVAMAICALTASAQTFDNEALTATWSMAEGEASEAVITPEDAIVSAKWSMGSTLEYYGVTTFDDYTMTQVTRVGTDKGENKLSNVVTAESYIDYTIVLKDGLTFTPEKASFSIVKFGTGDPNIFVNLIAGSTTTVLGDNVVIRRNNDKDDNTPAPPAALQSFDIANITATGAITLRIYVGKMANNKQVGIANVVVTGKVSGTGTNKSIYAIAVKANPAEGGKVSTSAENVTEGDAVTLTATPNRGYNFVNWTDAAGTEVSKEATYTFTPAANGEYTANFALADVRTISVSSTDETAGTIVKYIFSNNALVNDDIVLDGDSVIIEARNEKGYLFKQWSDGNTEAVRSFIVNGDADLKATFEVLPEKQAIAYFAASPQTIRAAQLNLNPTFVYDQDLNEVGFTLEENKTVFGENMMTFGYPSYNADDPSTKKDSTFYITLNPTLADGQVLVIRSIEFNAVRNGTDAGDWRVSIIRDEDEDAPEVIAEGFKPNRNNNVTLSHYYFNVTTEHVAEQNAEVRITICHAGGGKTYGLNKVRIQGYICDKTAVGISEVATEKANTGIIYNLAGQRVTTTQKGLYIRDGKKFMK